MQRRRAMAGKVDMVRVAQSRRLQEAGDPAAARGIRLLHVHRAARQHPPKVVERCSRIRRPRCPSRPGRLAHLRQPVEIIR